MDSPLCWHLDPPHCSLRKAQDTKGLSGVAARSASVCAGGRLAMESAAGMAWNTHSCTESREAGITGGRENGKAE